MDYGHAISLTAPEPELEALSFAHPEPEAVGEWISRLPMANVSESAGQIRQATFEIARLDTDWSTRMDLLEGVRPTVLYLAARLDKAAYSAGSQSDAITRLAQRLQTNLCSGYRAVVLSALDTVSDDEEACEALSLALHRALTDLSRTLLRTLQYYVAPADRLWLMLNQLYHLAEQLGIQDHVHADTEDNTTLELSITGAYLRALLLAMAKPYQLRPRQLADLFRALSGWVPVVSLSDEEGTNLHVIDLASDQGPRYAKQFQGGLATRGIRSDILGEKLHAWLQGEDSDLTIPADIDDSLISHLAEAWGEFKPRAFSRSCGSSAVNVCVGMRSAHFYLSGSQEFSEVIGPGNSSARQENPFLMEEIRLVPRADEVPDVWEDAFDVGRRIPENPNIQDPDSVLYAADPPTRTNPETTYPEYNTITADMSPGGYRLRWNEPFPPHLQAGEIIGLHDEMDPHWYLGIARWIRQDDQGPFMGVELLAPKARPTAVRLVRTKGGPSDYQRAFLLPELEPLGRPSTLITPATPFQSGQKVQVWENGAKSMVQLGECLLSTDSFNQFTFRVLDGYLETPDSLTNMGSSNSSNNTPAGFR